MRGTAREAGPRPRPGSALLSLRRVSVAFTISNQSGSQRRPPERASWDGRSDFPDVDAFPQKHPPGQAPATRRTVTYHRYGAAKVYGNPRVASVLRANDISTSHEGHRENSAMDREADIRARVQQHWEASERGDLDA